MTSTKPIQSENPPLSPMSKQHGTIFNFLQTECNQLITPPNVGIVILNTQKNTILQLRHNHVRLIHYTDLTHDDYLFKFNSLELYKNATQLNKSLWPAFIEKIQHLYTNMSTNKALIYDEVSWPSIIPKKTIPLKPHELTKEESYHIKAGLNYSNYDLLLDEEDRHNHSSQPEKKDLFLNTIQSYLKHTSTPSNSITNQDTLLYQRQNLSKNQPYYHKKIMIWLFSFIKTFNRFLTNVETLSPQSNSLQHFITQNEPFLFDDLRYTKLKGPKNKIEITDLTNSFNSKLTNHIKTIQKKETITFLSDLYLCLQPKGPLKRLVFKKICHDLLAKKTLSSKDSKAIRKLIAIHYFSIELPYLKTTPKTIYDTLYSQAQQSFTSTPPKEKKPIPPNQNQNQNPAKNQNSTHSSPFLNDTENLHYSFYTILGFLTRLILATQFTKKNYRNDLYELNSIISEKSGIQDKDVLKALEKWEDYPFIDQSFLELTFLSNIFKQSGLMLDLLITSQQFISQFISLKDYYQSIKHLLETRKQTHSLEILLLLGSLQLCHEFIEDKKTKIDLETDMITIIKTNTTNKSQSMALDIIKILCKQTENELKIAIKHSKTNLIEFLFNHGKYAIHNMSKKQKLHIETSETGINIEQTSELPL